MDNALTKAADPWQPNALTACKALSLFCQGCFVLSLYTSEPVSLHEIQLLTPDLEFADGWFGAVCAGAGALAYKLIAL